MSYITEIIPENRPRWFDDALSAGNLFAATLERVAGLEEDIRRLTIERDSARRIAERVGGLSFIGSKS